MTGTAEEGFGSHPFGEIAKATVAAQERSLELAQSWSDSLRELVTDQAEGGRAALEALTSTLAATERALASQEEANRALRQSLEAYREVIERASATQERSARLVQAALEKLRRHHPGAAGADQGLPGPPGPPARGLRQPGSGLERRLPAAVGGGPGRPVPAAAGTGVSAPCCAPVRCIVRDAPPGG